MGRPQCARCGRLKAVEQLAKHLARQERHLQDLKWRVLDTDRKIAEHEARQHARRVQQDGQDYVQHSYLFHHSSDNSSTGSDDSIDSILLAVGEESLDDYLNVCDSLHEVVQRLERAQHTQRCLAREIEAAAAAASGLDSPGNSPAEAAEEGDLDAGAQLEALHVKLTRAVAASILQQQQERDVAKELQVWETKVKERNRKIQQLQQQLQYQELESRQRVPAPSTGPGAGACHDEATAAWDSVGTRHPDDLDRMRDVPSFCQGNRSTGPKPTSVSQSLERMDLATSNAPPMGSSVFGGTDAGFEPKFSHTYNQAPPRSRSRSKERWENPKPPVPLPRSYAGPRGRLPVKPCSYSQNSASHETVSQPSTQPMSWITAEVAQKSEESGADSTPANAEASDINDCSAYLHGHVSSGCSVYSESKNISSGCALTRQSHGSGFDGSAPQSGEASTSSDCSMNTQHHVTGDSSAFLQTYVSCPHQRHAAQPQIRATDCQRHTPYSQNHAPQPQNHASYCQSHTPHAQIHATPPQTDASRSHNYTPHSHGHAPYPQGHVPYSQSLTPYPQTRSSQAQGHASYYPGGVTGRCFELYSSSSSKDDSGLASSDSSTDSGLLLFDTVADHSDGIGEAGRRGRPPADSDSYLDVSVSYGGCEPVQQDADPCPSSFTFPSRTAPSRQFDISVHEKDFEPRGSTVRDFSNGMDGSEFTDGSDGNKFTDSRVAKPREFTPKWSESSDDCMDTVPVIVDNGQRAAHHHPVSIISTGRHKNHAHDPAISRAKTVRFADEMTSWTWCRDDAADSSDDTGLSSLHGDDVLETLV